VNGDDFSGRRRLAPPPFEFIVAVGMILVDRTNVSKAYQSLRGAGRLVRKGRTLISFPEGTRSVDGSLKRFKMGTFIIAIEAGVPVVPVITRGTEKALPPGGFRLRPAKIVVSIGKPIATENLTQEKKEDLSKQVRGEMQTLLDEL